MTSNASILTPPPKLKAAQAEAKGLAEQGREMMGAFRQGAAVDPDKVAELTEALRAGNAHFREEWAAQRTKMSDGMEVFTPDFLAVQRLLEGRNDNPENSIIGADANGRVIYLQLALKGILDITPISNLTALRHLLFSSNLLQDLGPLSGLTELSKLVLHDNRIQDLSPLSGLTALQKLDLRSNRIEDIGALSGLAALEDLLISSNPVGDLDPLRGLSSLKALWVDKERRTAASARVLKELSARGVRVVEESHHAG
jgi:Leucine-rich repeat (LRR) protein